MSEQDKQDVKQPEITQDIPSAPMGEWTPPEKYEVKKNSGYGMVMVIFCVVVLVLGYCIRQYNQSQEQNKPIDYTQH